MMKWEAKDDTATPEDLRQRKAQLEAMIINFREQIERSTQEISFIHGALSMIEAIEKRRLTFTEGDDDAGTS